MCGKQVLDTSVSILTSCCSLDSYSLVIPIMAYSYLPLLDGGISHLLLQK